MRLPRGFAAISALAIGTLSAPVQAQDLATAKALFDQGLSSMQEERYDKGCPAIEESYNIDPRPGTLFTLAECENKRGRLATAMTRYDAYLAMYARMSAEQQQKQGDRQQLVRDQKRALRPEVPELILLLPPDAPLGTVIKRDGVALVATAIGSAVSVDPGEYTVSAQAPGGEVIELRVKLGKGEKKKITLAVKNGTSAQTSVSSPAPAISMVEPGITGRRMGAYAAFGVGITGLVLGGVTGGLTLGKKSELGAVSVVSLGVGAAGVVAGVVLLLTEPRRTAEAPRGVRVGVLSAGPEGATAGIQGQW